MSLQPTSWTYIGAADLAAMQAAGLPLHSFDNGVAGTDWRTIVPAGQREGARQMLEAMHVLSEVQEQ